MNDFSSLFDGARVMLYHKQSTSAMTRFFMHPGGVVIGRALPELAAIVESGSGQPVTDNVVPHPGALAAELEQWLGLPTGSIEVNADFAELVEVPGSLLRVYLLRFTTIDPPFDAAAGVDARFEPLTRTRGLPPVQMELLRTAYAAIMEG